MSIKATLPSLLLTLTVLLDPSIGFAQSLTHQSTTVGTGAWDGCMYEVAANNDVTIERVGVHRAATDTFSVDVWYRLGGMAGPTDPGWTQAGVGQITAAGEGNFVQIPVDLNVALAAGESVGIAHVRVNGTGFATGIRYESNVLGTITSTDIDLILNGDSLGWVGGSPSWNVAFAGRSCHAKVWYGLGGVGIDNDGDGDGEDTDCDDNDPNNSSIGTEVCDGQDNDCDGLANYDVAGEVDADNDGFLSCEDCDDTDPTSLASEPEICDGLDNDCNGVADFDGAQETDYDGDGFLSCEDCVEGDPNAYPGAPELCNGLDDDCDGAAPGEDDGDGDSSLACEDCDDTNPDNYPGNLELCDQADNDCDGAPGADEFDADADGQLGCEGDCDDTNANTNSNSVEVCDGNDNDCDGVIPDDEADPDADGWGLCEGDCDDSDPASYPGATEVCDGADNDCNTSLPPDEDDLDADGWMPCEGDCDDDSAAANPDATEADPVVCADSLDNDCDGLTDLEDEDCAPFLPSGDDDDSAGDDDDDDDDGRNGVIGCGCTTSTLDSTVSPRWALLMLGLLGAVRRRRA